MKKNSVSINIIAIIGILLALFSIIYGSIKPYIKASRYIDGLRNMQQVKTTQEFKNNFNRSLEFNSPIGQEEVVKYLANDILGIIQKNQSEAVSRDLVGYIEPYLFKNDVRHLLSLAQMYNILWQKFGKEEDYKKSEEYYRQGLAIGPKIPPLLYGLLGLYQSANNVSGMEEIGNTILKYWPQDDRVRTLLDSLKK